MKAKNILIIFFVNYLILLVVCAFAEIIFMANNAQHVQLLTKTAATMALQQAQATDDFFVGSRGYNIDGNVNAYSIKMQKGSAFEDVSMYGALLGVGTTGLNASTNDVEKGQMFTKLFNTPSFKEYAIKLGNIRTSVPFWEQGDLGFTWYKMARVAQVGTNVTGANPNVVNITTPSGGVIDPVLADKILNYYHFNQAERTGYQSTSYMSGNVKYYNTPLSLGLTYFNEDFLGALFVNNMDLLMRTKYSKNQHDSEGTNDLDLNTPEGGAGILKGVTYSDLVDNTTLSTYNPINDGIFTFVRGEELLEHDGVKSYKGVTPVITYKVIDMYDSRNDPVLSLIFGANRENENSGVMFPSKAKYLQDLDKNVLDPATGSPYPEKNIVVAKVTFYADIIIPYTTPIVRELRGKVDPHANNYLDLVHTGTTGKPGLSGNDCYSYTTYFAVAP